jgi:protein-S-isoprenylcysteine O-methyltransferase Ste14
MEGFFARGGWWVVAQFTLFGLIAVALAATGGDAPVWLAVIGGVAVAGGGALGGTASWQLRHQITALPVPLPGGLLIDDGAFHLVRHPIYGGLVMGSAGLAAMDANLLALAGSLSLLVLFLGKTRLEERFLTDRYPDYPDYRRRVPHRLLPWVL